MTEPEYEKMNLWDLLYISTSCEEDNDSESEEEDDEEEEKKEGDEEEEKAESPKKKYIPDYVPKEDRPEPRSGIPLTDDSTDDSKIPPIARKLPPVKKGKRIFYAYTYDTDSKEAAEVTAKKSIVIKKRVEARQPQNLIDLLVMQKSYMYDRE